MANIVLTLFLGFQWLRDRSRENAVREYLLAIRRMADRDGNSPGTLDAIDATLATIGSRRPFVEWGDRILRFIRVRSENEERSELSQVRNKNRILSPIQQTTDDTILK